MKYFLKETAMVIQKPWDIVGIVSFEMSSRSSDDLALKEKSAMTELEFLQRQMTPMACILLAHKIEPR